MAEKKNTYVEANREIKDGFYMNENTKLLLFILLVIVVPIAIADFEALCMGVFGIFAIVVVCVLLYWAIKLFCELFLILVSKTKENEKVIYEELVLKQGDRTEQNENVTKEESVSKKGDKMDENKKFVYEGFEDPSTAEVFGVFKSFFKGLFFVLFIILNSPITTNILLGLIAWCILDKYLY